MEAVTGITAIICEALHVLCPGSFSLAFGNAWLQIINIFSISAATYALVELLRVIKNDIPYDLEITWKLILVNIALF